MFFDIELPSGRIYSKDLALRVVEDVGKEDISIMADVNGLRREIGICNSASIFESGVIGNLVLDPRYKRFEDVWNIKDTAFSVALEMSPLQVPSLQYTEKELKKFEFIYAHM